MQTDIPLKRLTSLRASDLLPLLNEDDCTVAAVETLELPASATRLDNLLRLRGIDGEEHLHVIEWQGYHDPAVLWRFAGYLTWLGQRHPETAVTGTIIYLTPAADVGDTLRQRVNGRDVLVWPMPTVRLWQLDAEAAVRQGGLGLAVLSPLMQGTSVALVEQVITQLLSTTSRTQQADLLSILGVFAAPLIAPNRFIQLVGREQLMASDLISYLFKEQIAEHEQRIERATAETQRALAETQQAIAETQQAIAETQQAIADIATLRFPNLPDVLVQRIQFVREPDQLRVLRQSMLRATNQAAVEALLAAIPATG